MEASQPERERLAVGGNGVTGRDGVDAREWSERGVGKTGSGGVARVIVNP